MTAYIKDIQIRWGDLDPNFHVTHTKYFEFGAFMRMAFFAEHNCGTDLLQKHGIGVVLLREECSYRREIRFEDKVTISFQLEKAADDFSRWSVSHEIIINGSKTAALLNADGAFLDSKARRITAPPPEIVALFQSAPKSASFAIFERSKK